MAAQALFQLQFQTGLAHQVAHGQIGIFLHLGAVGFGHIAEHVGEKVFFGIVAVGADHDLQAGPVDQLGLDAGHLAEIQAGDQRQGLEGLGVVAVLELLQRRVRPLADLGQGGGDIRAVLADDGQAVGRAVVGQDIAVIVEDAAARGEDALRAQAVFLGLGGHLRPQMELEVPEAGDEDEKEDAHQHLQEQDAAARRLVAFAFHLYGQPGTPVLALAAGGLRQGRGRFRSGRGEDTPILRHANMPGAAWPSEATRPRAGKGPGSGACPKIPADRNARHRAGRTASPGRSRPRPGRWRAAARGRSSPGPAASAAGGRSGRPARTRRWWPRRGWCLCLPAAGRRAAAASKGFCSPFPATG